LSPHTELTWPPMGVWRAAHVHDPSWRKHMKVLSSPARSAKTGTLRWPQDKLPGTRRSTHFHIARSREPARAPERSCHPVYPEPTIPAKRAPRHGLAQALDEMDSAQTIRTRVRQQQGIAGVAQKIGVSSSSLSDNSPRSWCRHVSSCTVRHPCRQSQLGLVQRGRSLHFPSFFDLLALRPKRGTAAPAWVWNCWSPLEISEMEGKRRQRAGRWVELLWEPRMSPVCGQRTEMGWRPGPKASTRIRSC